MNLEPTQKFQSAAQGFNNTIDVIAEVATAACEQARDICRDIADGQWSAGYWWSTQDRLSGPGC